MQFPAIAEVIAPKGLESVKQSVTAEKVLVEESERPFLFIAKVTGRQVYKSAREISTRLVRSREQKHEACPSLTP